LNGLILVKIDFNFDYSKAFLKKNLDLMQMCILDGFSLSDLEPWIDVNI
jgi:hypothetical protein